MKAKKLWKLTRRYAEAVVVTERAWASLTESVPPTVDVLALEEAVNAEELALDALVEALTGIKGLREAVR